MPRILSIKKAFVEDEGIRFAILDDMALLERFLTEVYAGTVVDFDTCGVSTDKEWLIKGRPIHPETTIGDYDSVFVFIHSNDSDFDYVKHILKTTRAKVVYMYDYADTLFHHAERLESLMRTHRSLVYPVKFPHQKHVDLTSYNDTFKSVEDIVRDYYRSLFLPIEVVDTDHKKHPQQLDIAVLENPTAFAEEIHKKRHISDKLTFREHISPVHVWVVVIPNFRNERLYTTIALTRKKVGDLYLWDVFRTTDAVRNDIKQTVSAVSTVAFGHKSVVYTLAIHHKRGVFVKSTNDLLFFAIHHPDFFFDLAKENGIAPLELFETLRYNP